MILRRCRTCRSDRKLDQLKCACGSTKNDTSEAIVVIPGSKSSPTLKGDMLAEEELRNSPDPPPNPSTTPQQQPTGPSPYPYRDYLPSQFIAPTLAEIWKTYSTHIELRNRLYKSDVQHWRDYLKKPLGNKPADQIRPADIQTVVDGCIRKGLSPATTLQVFALARAMFNYADRLELTIGLPNPCRKVQVPKFDNKVTNPLTPEDFAKLVKACNAWEKQPASLVTLFCAYSGRRMGEVLKLEWNDVNLDETMVCFRAANTKSGKTQTVPVNDKALKVLKAAEAHRLELCVIIN